MQLLDVLRRMAWDVVSGPLDLDLEGLSTAPADDAPPLWQFSSFELMNGVDVTDFSETISGDAFRDLFQR
ncbi:hypothetical protein [Rhizobacter sp. Root404]|jgi:hypothetical protein|uniref:hypothetical protein n=1 Tax=Rhizobacter sp. Root404 TaxID=1736528 RepID=UPI000B199B85|nr:hypothetical protein [Rhizobacter sp. Root404]